MPSKIYVITSTGTNGTGATDECLREIKQAGVVLIETTTGEDIDIEDIGVFEFTNSHSQMPEFPVIFPVDYVNWDTEGMLHMEEVHTKEFYLTFSAPKPSPNLYRRLEKRPYSGRCNLRF